MLSKVSEFSKAVYNGFVLKEGYVYGTDSLGRPIATSTCVKDGKLAIYTQSEDGWHRSWVALERALKLYPELKDFLASC